MLAPPPSAALRVGHVLGGRFEVIGVLGEGGTGIVYDALALEQELEDGRRPHVALKVIHAHLVGDDQIRKRFAREGEILKRLAGPHLCPVLDFGELAAGEGEPYPRLFLALRKVEGPALDDVLREQGPLSPERAVGLALQMCDALSAAHAEGIIHRDLKPGNVLLEGGTRVVVVDFGMAKLVTGKGADATALTQRGMVFGTPEYMAPEQARGDSLDARCDVYAVGVVLYEMLTGEAPFSGRSPLAVLSAHLTQQPAPLGPRAAGVSVALEAAVMHALAKKPDDRYASARSLRLALTRALDSPNDVLAVTPDRAEIAEREYDTLGHAETIPVPEPTPPVARHLSVPASAGDPARPRTLPARAPSVRPPAPRRAWVYLWLGAVALGIAIGIYRGLR